MATADSVKSKLQGLIDQANAATGRDDTDLTMAVGRLIEGFGSDNGGGGATVTEFIVTEDADRSLWLNEQGIKLVKGVNLLVSSKMFCNAAGVTAVQGAVTAILLLWDGVACTANTSTNTSSSKSHVRSIQVPQSAYSLFAALTALCTGNTSAIAVAEDGLLTCTTSATGVTTENYNNSFIEGGYTYYLVQVPSEEVC